MKHTPLVTVSHLSIRLLDRVLVDSLSFSLAAGDVLALVGPNGCGKSTVLRLIEASVRAETFADDSDELTWTGSVTVTPAAELVHLPQRLDDDSPLFREVSPTASEGQRQRAAIAAALAMRGDLYLLDEPTNYLDIEGIVWLEEQLHEHRERGAGIVVVSHDRRLIDNLAHRTVVFTANGVFQCTGGYTNAQFLAEREYSAKRHQATVIGNKIKQLESEARSRMGWAANKEKSKRGAGSAKPVIAKQAAKMAARAKAARAKADKEIERLKETRPFVPKPVRLRLPEYVVRPRTVCALEEVSFGFERDKYLLKEISLGLSTKDRVCILGANGSGKSTLLRIIAGHLTVSEGEARRNENVPISCLPQGFKEFFKGQTLLEGLGGVAADEATVRTLLGGVMIRGDKVHQSLASLSPGELAGRPEGPAVVLRGTAVVRSARGRR